MTTIHRQVHCEWCCEDLDHASTGRAKRFCSTRCRVAYSRAMKRHAAVCVEAALAGQPEPPRDFGQPVKIRAYEIDGAGNVTKRARPGGER